MIYFDYAATSPVYQNVSKITSDLIKHYFNPSSPYPPSRDAYMKIYKSKSEIINILSSKDTGNYDVYFTSGGTEGNNWAIYSVLMPHIFNAKEYKIITTEIEHPSVYNTISYFEKYGFNVVRLKPNREGVINIDDFKNAFDESVILVSVMMVNNQTGAIQPIHEISDICKDSKAIFHSDCVQAIGHIPIDLSQYEGLDIITASSHKFGGLKCSGFLISKTKMNNLLFGGNQNYGLRPGTDSIINACTTAEALKESVDNLNYGDTLSKSISILEGLSDVDYILNSSLYNRSPYIISISLPGVNASELSTWLSANDIYISTTSACESSESKTNRVLESQMSTDQALSTIRISFSNDTTIEECQILSNKIIEFVQGVK